MTLYRDDILDHWQHPQNFGTLLGATHQSFVENVNCGDSQTVGLKIENGVIVDARFQGTGCAISLASSSLLSEYVKGKTIDAVLDLGAQTMSELLGSPVAPGRIKCATLGLRAFQEAIKK